MAVDDQEHDETTPLIRTETNKSKIWGNSVLLRGLMAGFLVSLSFGVTQVPLIYVFRVMVCDEYYNNHPLPPPDFIGDKCNVRYIESQTAYQVAILSGLTTGLGLINLFGTGWSIRKIGIKSSLVIQVFWPAMRLLVQNIGVEVGAGKGILITQLSQVITIVGGPVGYLLSLNNYITEVVDNEERTGALGKLQGFTMLGTAIGYLAGGLIGEKFGIIWPFRLTFLLFLTSTLYCFFALPSVPLPPSKETASLVTGKAKPKFSMKRILGPMAIFAPQKWISQDGKVRREWGALLLAVGCFFGVLATGVIHVLLQMFSTDVLGFGTALNSELVSLNSLLRGLFLTLLFPRIIKRGRAWLVSREERKLAKNKKASAASSPGLESRHIATADRSRRLSTKVEKGTISGCPTAQVPLPSDLNEAEEPALPPTPPSPAEEEELNEVNQFAFDLLYTRYSLIADGLLTGLATFVTEGWQIFAVAIVLPFASGTGSAAKGTILQMCPPESRTDALQAMTLVDMIARLSTITLFGIVFAAFAEIGQTHLVFTVNAAIAILGFIVLLFCRFPFAGSRRWDPEDEDETIEE